MPERPLHVVIAGDTIPGMAGGLGYFLLNAVRRLAEAQPSWQFKLVATSSFRELSAISAPNLKVIFWEDASLRRAYYRLLTRFFPDKYAKASLPLLAQFAPTRWLKARFGNLRALYGSLGEVDAVWLPQYAIAGWYHFSPLGNLSLVRAPILFTVHDIHPVFFPDDWPETALDRFWNEFVTFARRSQRIITHTQFQKAAIVEHLGVEPDKIFVTPCPPLIDGARILQTYGEAEKASMLSDYRITLPFAFYPGSGSITHKNHTRLLLAWAELKHRLGTKCPMLVCTVKGGQWPALKALIGALGLQDCVVFTDKVDTATLAQLYQTCAFVIVPTLYEGGGSGPVAEAIIAGKPVVCSKIPQIEEQLQTYELDTNNSDVTFFSPESVDSIVLATESLILGLSALESQARMSQGLMLSLTSKLWEDWAAFYAEQIRIIVRDRKGVVT
jgi:glycosyltransferase involved in cell wall biosynthesis